MKFIKFLQEKRLGMILSLIGIAIVAVIQIVLHNDTEMKFFLMIWTGISIAAITYTYYEFKSLDKNDWI